MLQYDKERPGQEGLHRAVAAKNAGVKSMPVHIYHSTQKGGNWNTSDKKQARQKEKAWQEELRAKQERDKKWKEELEADKKAHPEKYNKERVKKPGDLDTSDVLGPGW